MKFEFPLFFFGFILLIPLGFGLWLLYKRSTALVYRFFQPEEYALHWPLLKNGLRMGSAVLLLFALTGPYAGFEPKQTETREKEVYFLLDVSASMNAADVKPSRLKAAKKLIQDLAERLQGDKLGLIAFTDYPYVQCPLTSDAEMFKLFSGLVATSQFANKGTDFRKALSAAIYRFDKSAAADALDAENRCIVLLSDGQNHSEAYHSLLSKLNERNIALVPVGFGTTSGAPIPRRAAGADSAKTWMRDRRGEIIRSPLMEGELKKIASAVGEDFIRYESPEETAEAVHNEIIIASGGGDAAEAQIRANSLYQWFLGGALLLLFASMFILTERKRDLNA